MRIFLSFFLLIFLANSISVFAQDQCAIALSEAEDKYEQGRLYEIPGIIEACLKNGFTNEEKERAYRLLTLSKLFLNYQEEADSVFLKLLKLNPIYETDDLDPIELVNHSKKFTTKPKYILSGKFGMNISNANLLLDYSISNPLGANYSSDYGFTVGGGAETEIWKDLHLAGEIFYSQKRIHQTEGHFGFYTTNLDIVHREIELPIILKYHFYIWKLNPYCLGGLSPSFLLHSSMSSIVRTYRDPNGKEFVANPQIQDFETSGMKKRFNYSLLLGAGINYKIGLNYVTLEARYSVGMRNVTDMDNRYNISSQREIPGEDDPIQNVFPGGRESKFPLGYIDDDFKINTLSILVGFVYPLYKPRKIE